MRKFRLSIYEPEHIQLRQWLITKRKEVDLTQRELATKLNVVPSLVAKVETGERRLDIIEFIDYCEALAASPYDCILLIQALRENQS